MAQTGKFAVAVAAVLLSAPVANAAPMECKPNFSSPMVLNTSDVDTSWKTAVTQAYDASWADFGRAKNKKYHDVNLGLGILHYVIAQPCRPWRPAGQINRTNGVLQKAP
ncbi:MAG: hypothetical protein WDM94_11885 [Bauldia sp.]